MDGKSCQVVTSTPEGSLEALHDSDLSIIPNQPPSPILVSDSSTADLDLILETCISHQQLCSRDCDIYEQPTIRLDDSLTSQHQSAQRNKNVKSLDDHDRSSNKSRISEQNPYKTDTSDRKRNKSRTSDVSQTAQDESTQRNKNNMDQISEQLASDKVRLNLEYLSCNKSDTSKENGNKSETKDRKRNKSITSENKSVFCQNKTSGDTLNINAISQVESWLETSNLDASVNASTLCMCRKNNAPIQMPNRVRKCDCCDLNEEELCSLRTQLCDCSTDFKEGKKETSLQSQLCDCGSANDSAGVQKCEGRSQTCDCSSADAKEGNNTSLQSQICIRGCSEDSAEPHEIVKVEEQSFANDAKLKLKACPCTKLECMKKVETEDQNEDKADVATLVKEDSGGGSSCAGACEQYYRNKLMATLQILDNKEETIRVQGSSLGVAEARIATLTERACALRCELDQKARELNKLRKFAESCRVEKADISITTEMQEVEIQKNIVHTLQDNLCVVAELYRECFFETAKQEEMVDMLRKSYLDVRLMDKDKSDKINRLQNVINTQKWSIEQCQDVVIEVENLKSEIFNFLNSSNNDSGMWERGSETPDVGEELGDILEQLRQLQDMLTGDCICGLQDENKALKKKNEHLEMQVDKLRHRVSELEGIVSSSHSLGQQYQKQIEEKEQEFYEVRQRLMEFEAANKERGASCETLTRQLQQSQVLLDDKIAELAEAQRARAAQESAVLALRQELEQADKVIKEGLRKLVEASQWRGQLEASQARVGELERRLQAVSAQCRDLEMYCSEKERNASVLQGQLEEAHARGAALCDESRRVTACVRHWMRRQRALAREQQEKIKMQESMLSELQRCVEAKQNHSVRTSTSEIEPCCSNSQRLHACASETYSLCSRTHQAVGSETAFSHCGTTTIPNCESERPNCSQCASNRQGGRERSSESEMASCSSAPVPPRRRKKLPPCGDTSCPWSPGAPSIRFLSLPRMSPTEEIVERVEHLHSALAATQRRWGRPRR